LDVERLVAMANDIAAFFDAEPDKAVAAEGVRFHMSRFWEPRMRRAIIDHVNKGGAGLTPTAVAAVKKLTPPAETNRANQST
jgi:formate dehydrogenase subunit delta